VFTLSLAEFGYKELKKTGTFVLPASRNLSRKETYDEGSQGHQPFSAASMSADQRARKIIRARPVKGVKDAV